VPDVSRSAAAAADRRGVFATQTIKQGTLMAVIPLDLALPVNTHNLLVRMDGQLARF
jgi:hypothetical protein